jgi:hypothetical protein
MFKAFEFCLPTSSSPLIGGQGPTTSAAQKQSVVLSKRDKGVANANLYNRFPDGAGNPSGRWVDGSHGVASTNFASSFAWKVA